MDVKILVLAAYALMIIIVGVIGLRKTKSFNDFFLGGGNVGPWFTAFSYATAYFSAVVFIGFAGKVGWYFGYSGIWIGILNALVGVLAVWAILGWRVKKVSTEMGVSTLSEFLDKRYKSTFLKIFASVAIFVFLVPYSAAVFIGLSYLFKSTFPDLGYANAVIFIAIFTTIYLVLGGYKSMTLIDTIFGIIMVVGVLIMVYFTIDKAGGLSVITTALNGIDPKLTSAIGPPGWWPLFSLIFLTSVAPFAMPQLIQKFYAVKDRKAIRVGMIGSTVFALLLGVIAYFMGSTTRFFASTGQMNVIKNADGALNVDALMPELLTSVIPESLFIIILLVLLSASMSTLASLILVSSSSLVKDFYAGFINKNVKDKTLMLLMRLGSVFFVLLSALIAINPPETIVSILGISWGAIGSTFLGPFLWGLFSKKVNKVGAIASMVGGLAICLILFAYGMPSPQAGTIGMIASLIINPIFSLFYKEKMD